MTYEEAIEYISERYVTMSMCLTLDECRKHNKAISMAIEALKKQIPEKPRETRCALMCSSCGHKITEKGCKKLNRLYCKKCGQAIDWEVSE